MEERKSKTPLGARIFPCATLEWSEAGQKDVVVYPAVGCGDSCDGCAWNPLEAARRLKEGHWVSQAGLRSLRFKRKENNHE